MLMCCLSCAKADSCEQADRVEDFCINYEERPQTNADRIRQMNDEELAEFLCYWDNCSSTEGLGYNTERVGDYWLCTAPGGGDINGECQACAMAWLKSPVEVEG